MAHNDFLKELQQQLNNFEEAAKGSLLARNRMKELEKDSGIILEKHKFNYENFLKSIVNDLNIRYTFRNFLVDADHFSNTVSRYKDVAFDLAEIKELVNQGKMKDETFFFASLSFYATNFEIFIRFLRPMANAIQKHHKYLKNEKGENIKKITNTAGTLKVFEQHNLRFYRLLSRFLDRNLRNSIAHANYNIEGQNLLCYKNKKIKLSISREKILKMIAMMGDVINRLQYLYFNQRATSLKVILQQKLRKQDMKSFLESRLI